MRTVRLDSVRRVFDRMRGRIAPWFVAPELWVVANREPSGWLTATFASFSREEAERRANGLPVMKDREMQIQNRCHATVAWMSHPRSGNLVATAMVVDASDPQSLREVAVWSGATPVTPNAPGVPSGAVMILNGVPVRDGDTIIRLDRNAFQVVRP